MYQDLIIKIKNAQIAGKKSVKMPYGSMDYEVAEVLSKRGFISSVEKKGKGTKRVISISLNDPHKGKQFQDVKFVSKPSRRIYVGYREVKLVRGGFGVAVLSTPKGIMTGDEARKQKVGGEFLFQIW